MSETKETLKKLIDGWVANGADPNCIQEEVREALDELVSATFIPLGWELWGDGNWRLASACSICGSGVPGICGHRDDPDQVVLHGIDALRRREQP
ncbi:MAG TPA: hypothetical protein VD994_07565 [Prosthecobacter sp.]|nr:hypothetical protein [Prosthecobacter sp.]